MSAPCATPHGSPHRWSAPLMLFGTRSEPEDCRHWIKTCRECGALLIEPFKEPGNTELVSRMTSSQAKSS